MTDEKLTTNHKNALLELPELSYSNLYIDNSDDGSGNVNLSVNTYIRQFGELLTQAIITLIEIKKKKEREKILLKIRLISLNQCRRKNNSKVLAKRLEKVFPNIIHSNQNAFVKGWSIFDALRTIEFWLFLHTLHLNFIQKCI